MTRAPLPPHFTLLVSPGGIAHLVHEQCRPGRDARGALTFQAKCGQQIVYARTLVDADDTGAFDCPQCFPPAEVTSG